MHPKFALPLAAAFVLVACGEDAVDEPKSMDEVVAEASRMEGPQPGKYLTDVEVVELDMPGLPAGQAEQIKQMIAGAASEDREFCLTQEEAEGGLEEMVRKTQEGNCTFQKFDAQSNAFDAKMTCESNPGQTAQIAMKGAMSGSDMKMEIDMASQMPEGAGGDMRMKMVMNSKRIGECS